MTREEIANLGYEELETRKAEIAVETDTATAEMIETLSAELDMIEERKLALDKEVEERKKAAQAVVAGAGKTIESRKESTMTFEEFRNSKAYVDAFANYIKTGKDEECRSLIKEYRAQGNTPDSTFLTENTEIVGEGHVPVPTFVESRVRTAWERDEIFNRVTKTFVKGNLKVAVETEADPAVIHYEGIEAPNMEKVTLTVINLVPHTIKKWVAFSTEVLAMGSEDFLMYVYDEITYRIIQKAAQVALDAILNNTNNLNGGSVSGEVTPATIIQAIANLNPEARDLVLIANAQTIANIRIAALNAHYAYDPFQGLTPIVAPAGVLLNQAIVGDLSGVQANLPEGANVRFVLDEYSLAEKDLIKLVGRLYAAIDVVGLNMFVIIDGIAGE
jgi:HK97 family phage major capsid protein